MGASSPEVYCGEDKKTKRVEIPVDFLVSNLVTYFIHMEMNQIIMLICLELTHQITKVTLASKATTCMN